MVPTVGSNAFQSWNHGFQFEEQMVRNVGTNAFQSWNLGTSGPQTLEPLLPNLGAMGSQFEQLLVLERGPFDALWAAASNTHSSLHSTFGRLRHRTAFTAPCTAPKKLIGSRYLGENQGTAGRNLPIAHAKPIAIASSSAILGCLRRAYRHSSA